MHNRLIAFFDFGIEFGFPIGVGIGPSGIIALLSPFGMAFNIISVRFLA